MGSFRVQAISDSLICRLYQDGLSRSEIGWRAHLYDKEVLAILRTNGIPLRSAAESQALSRQRQLARARLKAP